MSKNVGELVKEHHAFYEVRPYLLMLQENPGKLPVKYRRIQAGFDVDIYGVRGAKEPMLPGPDYALGYAEVQRLAQQISQQATNYCSVEAIASPEEITFGGPSHNQVESMLRIRISHHRGLDQAAGASEEQALKELESRLRSLGLARR